MARIYYLVSLINATVAAFSARPEEDKTNVVVTSEEEMGKIPTSVLVSLHNKIRPERPIQKFADRATANKRMWPALEVLAGPPKPYLKPAPAPAPAPEDSTDITPTPTPEDSMAAKTKTTKTKTPKTTPAKAKGDGQRGRPSRFAGMRIEKLVGENPRRENTFGHKSFAVIKNGMTYEQYLAAGGRTKDLAWDIAHKYVKVVKG